MTFNPGDAHSFHDSIMFAKKLMVSRTRVGVAQMSLGKFGIDDSRTSKKVIPRSTTRCCVHERYEYHDGFIM